jgi:ABC-type sugar transport system ATPase subunit
VADLRLERLRKVFPGGHVALGGLDLAVADGERLALVGPSGSGKSTVLRLIAGLESPTSGRVLVGGRDVTEVPPEERDLTMVFQTYALYPHMTVRANLGFGLRMRARPAAEIRQRVEATAATLGIGDLLQRMPSELSGGQRQRVALGRAIVRDPKAFLFDEPLSNLDPRLRGDVRAELVRLHGRLGTTMVYVTHDQEEAMTLGQRIAVLRDGALEQVGTPDEVYGRPCNVFVAGFIGSPPMNLLAGPVPGVSAEAGMTVGIRPHDVTLVGAASGDFDGRVDLVEPLGHAQIVHISTGARVPLIAVVASDRRVERGMTTGVALRRDRLHTFDARGRRVE